MGGEKHDLVAKPLWAMRRSVLGAQGEVRFRRMLLPNLSLHPTCYGWLRQPPPAGELKR